MQVRHGFTGIRAVVENQAEPGLSQPQLAGHLGGFEQEMPEQLLVFGFGLGNARDGFLGEQSKHGSGPAA